MDHGSRGLGALLLINFLPSRRLAFALSCALTSGCASGSAGISQMGRPSDRVSVATTTSGGDIGSVELTTSVSVHNSIVPAVPTVVWSLLPSVFERLQIETSVVDPGSLIIGNPGYRAGRVEGRRLSTYLDCGSGLTGPRADLYLVTLQWMVQLGSAPNGGTMVTTSMDAYARPRDVSGNNLHCVSKGTLERRIEELIAEGLAGEPTR